MASGKEIRGKIKSVKNTQKITRAMEMVAASKMRKAQDRMAASKPYAAKIRGVIGHLAMSHPEFRHSYMIDREVKRAGFILISTDRGLCGGLNTNMFKAAVSAMKACHDKGIEIDVCSLGQKGTGFFRRFGTNIVSEMSQMGDAPQAHDLIGSVKVMLDAYDKAGIDRLYLVYNEFINTMTQEVKVSQLLPIEVTDLDDELRHYWDYIYEPDAAEVLGELLMRYVESQVFQGVVENIACEQSARMVAMKAASDNAGTLIGELELAYNKARQAAITQELSEIVAGAAAV